MGIFFCGEAPVAVRSEEFDGMVMTTGEVTGETVPVAAALSSKAAHEWQGRAAGPVKRVVIEVPLVEVEPEVADLVAAYLLLSCNLPAARRAIAADLRRGLAERLLQENCPMDTNGDGDCGRRHCPTCGSRRACALCGYDGGDRISP